jgi:hypothetical protein
LSAAHVESVDPACAALQQDIREAARGCAYVETDTAGRVDLEGIERGSQLVATAADEWLRFGYFDRGVGSKQVAGLAIVTSGVTLPHSDLAGKHERLGAAARVDQATFDEELIKPDARRLRGAHLPIVAQPAAPKLTRQMPPDGAATRGSAGGDLGAARRGA